MTYRKRTGYWIRSWHVLVLSACIWCGVVYWLDAGWQVVAILLVISALLRLAWVTIIRRAREERERQVKLAAIMRRQPDQKHEWDRPEDTATALGSHRHRGS
jgi:hypothetical protein